jgi:hypothetical protein
MDNVSTLLMNNTDRKVNYSLLALKNISQAFLQQYNLQVNNKQKRLFHA